MGTLQLSEFRTELKYQIGNRSDLDDSDSTVSDRLDRWINFANRIISLPAVYQHPNMRENTTDTLVDGITRYSLPSDIYAIRFIKNETQDFKYDPVSDLDFFDRGSRSRVYCREEDDLLIEGDSQNDGDTVRIYYWKYAALLSADSDTTEIADIFDEPILDLATGIGNYKLERYDQADWFQSFITDLVNTMVPPEQFEVRDTGWRNDFIRVGNSAMSRGK